MASSASRVMTKFPLVAAALVLATGFGAPAAGQGRPAGAAPPQVLSWFGDPGSPNISGVWARAETAPPSEQASKEGWAPWPPPLRGTFAQVWNRRVAEDKAGSRTDDPVKDCLPAGMPRFITGMNGPLLITQHPGRVSMTREYGPPRRVWLDGRSLPEPDNLEQFYAGNSVGRYERHSLVVDTIGPKNMPIDATGVPHSDVVRIQERYRRIDETTLSVEVTVTDSLALSRPIRTTVTYKAVTDPNWVLQDLICTPRTGYHPELFVK